ncbi:proton-conducting transporter transmembrane domain-containing protein [Winogradskyella psychrotolerans]|uniref:proton-conducting transporter transmembrane domain-containing protein n=1 Tax=Winogradskyella psychrotolerans TaxID=1344585 RepID=UPI001C064BD8|nr:proton-conducting transporter membrane subunit [Winogradskyella psychrotolerans]MBU2927604.1 Na+/H+ antiporter subunit D [Winogradskyella psychrotolerans]
MMAQIVFLPIIVQLLLAISLLFSWKWIKWQKIISNVGSVLSLVIAIWLFSTTWTEGTLTVQAGNWQAPFGISFVSDTFAATLVLLTAISGMAVSFFSVGTIMPARLKFGFLPIFHFLLLGLNGAFLTGDIFNLYVWFEIIIISSFVLITLGGEKTQIEGAIKYFTLNIFASVIFLTAIAVLYGLTGSLNMADLALKVAEIQNRGLVEVTAILFLIGFGIKAALFPLYFWLPASYHTPPPAVSAIFGGLLTKVGVYALIRVFTLIFVGDVFLGNIILVLAGLTLFSGALGALTQNNISKVFSYLIICHIGYMILGLGMYTEMAITGVVFYLIHDIIAKTNLFMIGGLIYRITGTYSMRDSGGLYAKYPLISLLIIIPFFSLVGVPPLSGFWAKLTLISESFKSGNYWLIAAILFATFITLFVIARIWAEVFWKESKPLPKLQNFRYFEKLKLEKKILIVGPIVFLTLISLYIGFGAEYIQRLATRVANELMDNQQYIQAVLGVNTTN